MGAAPAAGSSTVQPATVQALGAPEAYRRPSVMAWLLDAAVVSFVAAIPFQAQLGAHGANLEVADGLAVAIIIAVLATRRGWRQPDAVEVWMIIVLASAIPALMRASSAAAGGLEWAKLAGPMLLAAALRRWGGDHARLQMLVTATAVAALSVAAATIVIWLWGVAGGAMPRSIGVLMDVPSVGRVLRINGPMVTPAMLACYLTTGVPIAAAWVSGAMQRRALCWGVLAMGLAAVMATASHGLAGYLLAAGLVAPAQRRDARWARGGVLAAAAATAVFALIATSIAIDRHPGAAHRAASAAPESAAHVAPDWHPLAAGLVYAPVSYGLLKRIAWEAWRAHPIIGIGLGEFPQRVEAAFWAGRIHYRSADPHCTWLGALAESGVLGAAGVIGFWIVLLRSGAGALRRAGAEAAWRVRGPLAGLCGLALNAVHVDVMHFRFLWVAVALLLAAASPRSQS